MVSLVMVLFDELVDELAHMSLAKRNHATDMPRKRPRYPAELKAKVALEALRRPAAFPQEALMPSVADSPAGDDGRAATVA